MFYVALAIQRKDQDCSICRAERKKLINRHVVTDVRLIEVDGGWEGNFSERGKRMREFLNQIESALQANLFYVSLLASLAVPDICGAINSEDGLATSDKYADWFDQYVGMAYAQFFNGEDCYKFRCSFLHQGSSQHSDARYSRILFVEPTASSNIYHCNIINDALNIDVRVFCRDIITGALQWLDEVEETELFQENYSRFMRRYPNGLPPYIDRVPVIG